MPDKNKQADAYISAALDAYHGEVMASIDQRIEALRAERKRFQAEQAADVKALAKDIAPFFKPASEG
jgi:uncharacterized small protein (DUF1192 family)